jgi:F-type H+-transporting ATPase subunit delta
MFTDRIARRYARALFATARDRDRLDDTLLDLQAVQRYADEIPDLREWLAHPLIPEARKKVLLHEIFDDQVDPLVVDFLCLLVDKERGTALDGVVAEFQRLLNEARGLVPARVTTAVPLIAEERTVLVARIREWTGAAEIDLQEEVDPDLLGGAVIQARGRLIDGSVRSSLAALRERLKRVRVTQLAGESE